MLYPDFSELVKLQTASTGNILKNKYSQSSLTAGDYNSLFRGQGMEFDSVRPYIVGDDIRHIDWRVTARTHKPHIKTFQAECDRKIMIVVDCNQYMRFGTRGTFKSIQAARAAALLAGIGFKNRDRVGSLVFGDITGQVKFFSPTRQRTGMLSFLKLLCEPNVANNQQSTLEFALQQLKRNISAGTLLFVITDIEAILAVKKELLSEIKTKNDIILLPVVDPIDSDFPSVMNVICTDNMGNKINVNATLAMQKKYTELWQTEQNQLKSLVKKYGLKLITLNTNQAVHRSLNYGLQHLRNY